MYKHHEESVNNMIKYFQDKGVQALLLGGSIANGNERPESDIDGFVILTEEEYTQRERDRKTTEVIEGYCTYEGGYFDIKYMTKQYLADLADKGSEPARNAFMNVQILFSNDPDIAEMTGRIPVFQKKEKEEKMLSFYSDFWLNYHYFLKSCKIDGFMRMRTIAEIIYDLYRMILQEHEILFACNRRLEQQVENLNKDTARLTELARNLEMSQSTEDADRFVSYFFTITDYKAPEDMSAVFTTYSKDFQEWWREYRPNIHEW